MTRADKPVKRISYATVRDRGKMRQVVVTIHPTWIELRLLGTQRKFTLDIGALFDRAAMQEALRLVAEKKKAKADAKKLKRSR